MVMICFVHPLVAVGLLPLAWFYWNVTAYARVASRDLQRLENVTRSPIFVGFAEVCNGLASIRAYGLGQEFTARTEASVDTNNAVFFLKSVLDQWLGMRLDLISCVLVSLCCLLPVLQESKDPRHAAFAGLVLTYSFEMSGYLKHLARTAAELEKKFAAVERLTEYETSLTPEAAEVLPTDAALQWPQDGSIVFEHVGLRYRPELPLVLKDVNFSVSHRERLGIVGRTGSGKSSLNMVLLRLFECSEGRILIGGVDTQTLGLTTMRRGLAMIPQDPFLFQAPLRFNLDPHDEFRDEEIWEVLGDLEMRERCERLPQQLQTPVAEGGSNFSVGERQLLCLVRAMLRRSKVLLLDEATASVDFETDASIQRTIRSGRFADSTLLVVAHRLNTILDSHRVLVMDDGEVAELDAPAALYAQGGKFTRLVDDAGVSHLISGGKLGLEEAQGRPCEV